MLDANRFGSLEWRRKARQLWSTKEMRIAWLRAVYKLLHTKRGWILFQ